MKIAILLLATLSMNSFAAITCFKRGTNVRLVSAEFAPGNPGLFVYKAITQEQDCPAELQISPESGYFYFRTLIGDAHFPGLQMESKDGAIRLLVRSADTTISPHICHIDDTQHEMVCQGELNIKGMNTIELECRQPGF